MTHRTHSGAQNACHL